MITTVYIIRHGKTVDAAEQRYRGHLDVPLSREGEDQMERLADHLVREINENGPPADANPSLAAVYCSDLQRAGKSAEIICRPHRLKPISVSDFRERGFGHWEGLTLAEITQTYPREFDAWTNDPLKFFPVGGESTQTVRDRVMPAFYALIENMKGKQIAIVAHGGVNRIILCELLGIPLLHLFKIEQDFSALNVCVFYDEAPVLKRMNCVVDGSRT